MPRVKVAEGMQVKKDGKVHGEGETLDVTPEEKAQLIAAGSVETPKSKAQSEDQEQEKSEDQGQEKPKE